MQMPAPYTPMYYEAENKGWAHPNNSYTRSAILESEPVNIQVFQITQTLLESEPVNIQVFQTTQTLLESEPINIQVFQTRSTLLESEPVNSQVFQQVSPYLKVNHQYSSLSTK